MTLAFAQLFHLGNARSRHAVVAPHRALSNRYALGAVALVTGLQLLVVYFPPLADVLALQAPTGREWAAILVLSLVPGAIGQSARIIRAARSRRAPSPPRRRS